MFFIQGTAPDPIQTSRVHLGALVYLRSYSELLFLLSFTFFFGIHSSGSSMSWWRPKLKHFLFDLCHRKCTFLLSISRFKPFLFYVLKPTWRISLQLCFKILTKFQDLHKLSWQTKKSLGHDALLRKRKKINKKSFKWEQQTYSIL